MSLISKLRTWHKRSQLRYELLKRDDHQLADIGISRALLETGVRAWPWLAPSDARGLEPLNLSAGLTERDYAKAMSELQSYSDAELADLGIGRGGIEHAVRHGRAGFPEEQRAREEASAPRKAA